MELQGRYEELRGLGLGIAAITYDAPDLIKKFADERAIEFPVLSDQAHDIVQRYGLLNRQYEPGHRNYGIPHPGTFILDREGRVLARYFEEEYQYRNTAATIALKIGQPVGGMGRPTRHSTPHFNVTAFTTDETVAPGHRFSIVLDITPGPAVRLVGPGQHGYRVVALNLEPDHNLRAYPMSHPRTTSELRLGAQSERLPVYAEPFRLIQDVAIAVNDDTRQLAQKPGATFELKATIEYQACTEQGCEPPQQLPLSFTVGVKPLG